VADAPHSVPAFLRALLDIRVTDVVDILLVTALVYAAIVWLRRTQAALVARGILLIALLYIAARALGLQLTAWIFQGFFAIFLIVIVVIFQEELRQLFERVALWRPRRRRSGDASRSADILVQCLTDLARDHIGALVVLPGSQPIGRYVQGGIELDGNLSVPLLKSLFDPHSPGHDGAVVVEDGRVRRFAAHLPLSRDFRQLAGVGTRHGAALGLAELTDAVCLVVSEERGRISVARDGRLRALGDPQELGRIVESVCEPEPVSGEGRKVWRHVVRDNWVEKVVALAVVVALWDLFVPGGRPGQMVFDLPITVTNLPAGDVLEDVEPKRLQVTFRGPARAFYLLDARKLGVRVDAAGARPGRRRLPISEKSLAYPRRLTVEEVRPSEVTIVVRRAPAAATQEAVRP